MKKIELPIKLHTETGEFANAIADFLYANGVEDIKSTTGAIVILVAVDKFQSDGLEEAKTYLTSLKSML